MLILLYSPECTLDRIRYPDLPGCDHYVVEEACLTIEDVAEQLQSIGIRKQKRIYSRVTRAENWEKF